MKQEFYNLKISTNGQKLYEFTDQIIEWIKKNKFQKALNFIREISNEKFYYHHIGLYAYRKNVLNKFVNMQRTENEINRSLEQMRFLDHNIDVFVGYTDDNPLSVDTKEDLEKIRKFI